MKICKLKLERHLWPLIEKGIKRVEIRKTNKGYIEGGDIIQYVDMENGEVLGYARVKARSEQEPYLLLSHLDSKHAKETIEFVKEHYLYEKFVIVMRIEPLRVMDL